MTPLRRILLPLCLALVVAPLALESPAQPRPPAAGQIRELNPPAPAPSTKAPVLAIVGATLVDGGDSEPVPDSVVVIRGDRIAAAGPRARVTIPDGAEQVDGKGLTVLPGLIDSHFHLDGDLGLPNLYLRHGITSVRDPGAWIEAYDEVRRSTAPAPRLFLCGPHLDSPPPAYPYDAYLVRDPVETAQAVDRFVDQGASAIKVYFRVPLGLMQAAVQAAHRRGVPVTTHLEIVDAGDAIRAGVDGVEHVTSFGTALLPLREAEKYRQAVLADNNARRQGRYSVWSQVDLNTARARELIDLIVKRGTYVSATLAVFERRAGEKGATEADGRAFRRMLEFVGKVHRAGGRVVPGSHSSVAFAERGWAYQRELELLVEAGMTPLQAIRAGTSLQARFFRVENRLGALRKDMLADLILVEGEPHHDIRATRKIKRVMLNGKWIQ